METGKNQILLANDIFNKDPNNLLLASYSKAGGHGDLFDALWYEDNKRESSIEFTKIDTAKNIIEGKFNLYFTLKSRSPDSPYKYAEQAHFRCCKFRAVIYD